MTAVVDICNQALAHLGIDDSITDIDDRGKAARLCRLFFDQTRDAVLRAYPWGFAQRTVIAAPANEEPPPGWAFVYEYPLNCLQVHAVMPEYGDRHSALFTRMYEGGIYPDFTNIYQRAKRRHPWERVYSITGPVIATDLEEAWIRYTVRVEEPDRWDALFTEAMSYAVAAKLAMPMAVSQTLAAGVAETYRQMINQAKSSHLNEGGPDQEPDSISITGRL